MRIRATALLLPALLAVAPAGGRAAEDRAAAETTPERLVEEGLQSLIQALELFFRSIPQYEAPVVTEEGDIVIRRKRRPAAPEEAPEPAPQAPADPEEGPIRI